MDFRTPDRSRYQEPKPVRRAPLASVPPRPEPQAEEPAPKKRRLRKPAAAKPKSWKKIIGAVIAAAVIAWLAYGYITTKHQLEQAKSPSATGQTPTQQVVSKVSNLVDVPKDESPTLANISNADALRKLSKFNASFFADAKNGDVLLIYSKHNKAIVYRPTTNKIIASGPYDGTSGHRPGPHGYRSWGICCAGAASRGKCPGSSGYGPRRY
jgi:hypothetical protein